MKILSKNVSDETAALVTDIEKSLVHPVLYLPVAQRQNTAYSVFGSVDPAPSDGVYKIWLLEPLPLNVFEANLLHELHHLVQIETGYPQVLNKSTAEFNSQDKAFIQEVGAHIGSVVLDIDVNIWLEQHNYHADYFLHQNLKGLLENCKCKYTMLDDPLNFANLLLAILQTSYYLNEPDAEKLFSAYSAYPLVTDTTAILRQELKALGIKNPLASLQGMGLIVDTLNLWKYYSISFPRGVLRTRKEYIDFLN